MLTERRSERNANSLQVQYAQSRGSPQSPFLEVGAAAIVYYEGYNVTHDLWKTQLGGTSCQAAAETGISSNNRLKW